MTWKLKRTKQCRLCPWRIDTNPFDIPNYDPEKHRKDLAGTIATPGSFVPTGKVMSCHEHGSDEGVHCVGWIVNQLGVGNNIPLRLQMLSCENTRDITVHGDQHERFEDTLPEGGWG